MPRAQRLISPLSLTLLLVAASLGLTAVPAGASVNQEPLFEADGQLRADPLGTFTIIRNLGADRVRFGLRWQTVAPSPNSRTKPSFNATDPGAYPAQGWAAYDALVRSAALSGVGVDFTLVGGAPLWATGSGFPGGGDPSTWKPSASEFAKFVTAVGKRYSGSYKPAGSSTPLPRVRYWAIWNEPNYGPQLSPQATNHSTVETSPALYRGLVDAAWSALRATNHGNDTILFGEVAPRGLIVGDNPGNFSGMVPLRFLRALYCVDASYKPLRGSSAAARGCPTSSAGSRGFRSAHPALFQATGFADHPYPRGVSPITHTWPYRGPDQYADLPQLPVLERLLDKVNSVYGSRTRLKIYNTEYGYQTRPPSLSPERATPTTAAYYDNWGEYISWRDPRMMSYMQYGLIDPGGSSFPSGLYFHNGAPKATLFAYRLPLFLPVTSTRKGRSLEVWGGVRAAHRASGPQQALIQFQSGSRGSFTTVKTVSVHGRGYFDVRVSFPASGSVRLAWFNPFVGATVYSRTQAITVR